MQIKIISLNTWYGGKLFEETVAFLKKENADILLLQEVYNSEDITLADNYRSFSLLSRLLNLEHAFFAPAFKQNLGNFKVDQGNAILSRWPITNQNTIFYDTPYDPDYTESPLKFEYIARNLQTADIIMPDIGVITVGNTQGIWGLDGGDSERRLQMSQVIIDALKDKERVILGGDFNLKPNTQTISNIEAHFTNVFKDELTSTFNMKRKDNPGYATAVVDMLFVSSEMTIGEHYCPEVDISDHLPLVLNIKINN